MRRRNYGEYYISSNEAWISADLSTKFGEPFQIAPVQGPSEQIQLKKKIPRIENFASENAEIGNNFLNSFVGFFRLAVPQFC